MHTRMLVQREYTTKEDLGSSVSIIESIGFRGGGIKQYYRGHRTTFGASDGTVEAERAAWLGPRVWSMVLHSPRPCWVPCVVSPGITSYPWARLVLKVRPDLLIDGHLFLGKRCTKGNDAKRLSCSLQPGSVKLFRSRDSLSWCIASDGLRPTSYASSRGHYLSKLSE
jgi:hypothetical protein